MVFFNRERDIRRVKGILSGEPNLVYFVYGPINSGKTALLTKVFEELSEEGYRIFYVNFRARDVEDMDDLLRVLFSVYESEEREGKRLESFLEKFLRGSTKVVEVLSGIPIPEEYFDAIFESERKAEDIFAFLEEYFRGVRGLNYRPVFVLDELQVIRDIVNPRGRPVLSRLFNFLIRLTKETHLCHCLCVTSNCLFIEEIYSNARLEGRAGYILVDDLGREEAFKVYEGFGFKEKELVWEYIGGKLGDMIRLFEMKKEGLSEREAVEEMLKIEKGRLEWLLDLLEEGEKEGPPVEEVREVLGNFKDAEEISYQKVKGKALKFLINENVIFYNPVGGVVRTQSRLLWRVIREVV